MTVFGNYRLTLRQGKETLDVVAFLTANWPLLCDCVELPEAKDRLTIIEGQPDPRRHASSMHILDSGKVQVNATDFADGVRSFDLMGWNPLGLCWGQPSCILRELLFREGKLPESERLDIPTIERVPWKSSTINNFVAAIRFPNGSDKFRRQLDAFFISGAVQDYCQWLNFEEEMDLNRIGKIIRTVKSQFDPNLFKLKTEA